MNLKRKREFFKSFFNNNYFRDLRILSHKKRNKNPNVNHELNFDSLKYSDRFFEQIYKNDKGFSDITAELYPCVNLNTFNFKIKYKDNENYFPKKVYDRLFFDFDFDKNEEVKKLKKNILKAINTNDTSLEKELRQKYLEILINEKLAIVPFKEMKKLHDYLINFNIKSYQIFSGSKGFHLYIFYPETSAFKRESINHISTRIAEIYQDKCKLGCIDLAVNRDAYSRISRLPYCKHPITNLYTYPIDINDNYEEIIENAFKPNIKELNLADYKKPEGNKVLTKKLITINDEYIKITKENKENKKKINQKRKIQTNKNFKSEKNFNKNPILNDCRDLADYLGLEKGKQYKGYTMYKCPLHNDNNPSMVVNEKIFKCYSCGFKYNYFDFLRNYCNIKTDQEVKKFIKKNF